MDKTEKLMKTADFLQKKLTEQVKIPVKVVCENSTIYIKCRLEWSEVNFSLKDPETIMDIVMSGQSVKAEAIVGIILQVIQKMDEDKRILFLEKQPDINSYERSKNNLILRPLNYEACKKDLMEVPHIRIGDIALVLYSDYMVVDEDYASFKINRDITRNWSVDEKTILLNALANTAQKYTPLILSIEEMLNNPELLLEKVTGHKIDDERWETSIMQSYVLYSTLSVNSAIAIFYPGILEKLADKIGDDLYLAFTSIHEVHVHAARSVDPDVIGDSLKDTNKACNEEKDILTNNIYFYNRKNKRLGMIAEDAREKLDWIFE